MNSREFWTFLFVHVFVLYNSVDGRINDLRQGTIDLAICGTSVGSHVYNGAAAKLAVYNPTVMDQQYSAARLKLQSGSDSIEAGWRVDPTLNGDNKTRLFMRTYVGQSECYNTQCSGFMVTNGSFPLDAILEQVSTRGGDIYGIYISIVHDASSGNWNLIIGEDQVQVGYWPKDIFSKSGLPNYIDFGGEVFSPDGNMKPRMGAGEFLFKDTEQDAFFSNIKLINETGASIDPLYLECSSDDHFYETKDEMQIGDGFDYLIFYGGPGTN